MVTKCNRSATMQWVVCYTMGYPASSAFPRRGKVCQSMVFGLFLRETILILVAVMKIVWVSLFGIILYQNHQIEQPTINIAHEDDAVACATYPSSSSAITTTQQQQHNYNYNFNNKESTINAHDKAADTFFGNKKKN
jgi:hypothetical protein